MTLTRGSTDNAHCISERKLLANLLYVEKERKKEREGKNKQQ